MSISITGHTGFIGLLGSPVAHSISPMIHNESFQYHGLDYVYLCFDVNEEGLYSAVEGLKAAGIRGFNLTMPNKNKMAKLVDHLSPAAKLIGAINTVVNDNGILTGHNTDGLGFMRSLEDVDCDCTGKTITVLGGGGAATAICAQAALDGVSFIHIFARTTSRFWNRTTAFVAQINASTNCHAILHDNDDQEALKAAISESTLLVNASSVGMAPDTDASLIEDPAYFHKDLTVYDVIYNPRETKLLRLAREAGCKTCNGLYMLLYQGAEAFRLWTGMEMPVTMIKEKYFQ